MIEDNLDSVIDHANDVLFDAREVLEELDPFANGTYPEIYSAVDWLLPYVEESRNWCSGLDRPLDFLDDEDDSFTPVVVMKIVLERYRELRMNT